MKHKLLLTVVAVFSFVVSFAQSKADLITVNISDKPLSEAVRVIENATRFTFFYDTEKTDMTQKVSLSAANLTVENAMKQMLSPVGIEFEIKGGQIVLISPSAPASKTPSSVTVTVLDKTDYPVIGAAILRADGTGEITDFDGNCTISLSSSDKNLTISCLGYHTKSIPVGNSAKLKVYLEEETLALDALVVIGYGSQKKGNLTGAISVVDSEAISGRSQSSLSNLLQGTVPGLTVTTSSGRPGAGASVNIRGVTSINGGNPLVLIDGAEGDLATVNPNDVESISVIKDASAAVYGARASFGVILVTTKNGSDSDGKATVRYSGKVGWNSPTASTDFETRGYYSVYIADLFYRSYTGVNLTTYTNADLDQLWARRNDVVEHPDRPWVMINQRTGSDTYVYYANTDWYHHIFTDVAPTTNHNVSLSGGSKGVKYFVSGGYDYQEGIIRSTPDVYSKFNFRAKLDFDINKWMKFSNNTSYYSSTYSYPGIAGINNTFAYAGVGGLASYPTQNPDGTSLYFTSYTGQALFDGLMTALDYGKHSNIDRRNNFATTVELTMNPVKPLEIKANFTYQFNNLRNINRSVNTTYSTTPGVIEKATSGNYDNSLKETNTIHQYMQSNVFATYSDTFADAHNLKVTGGFNWETKYLKDVVAKGYNLLTDDLSDLNIVGQGADGQERMEVSGGQNEYAIAGVFARANYDYKGRYLIEASGRYDGTSRFAKGHRWGFFPSASLGWRISEEDFFAPAKKVMNNLKLRYSFGRLGNQQVGYYDYVRKITIGSQNYVFGGDKPTTAVISDPNAGDLTWETAESHNLGIDAGFFDGRLSVSLEGYIRNTKNMLTAGVALPSVYGAASPKMNSADLRTQGYELSLAWADQFNLASKPFSYNVSVSFNDYVTEITKYDNPERSFAKSYYVGQRIGEIWGYKVDGLFFSDEEAAMYPVDQSSVNFIIDSSAGAEQGLRGGDLKFMDLDGDGKISLGKNTVDDPGDRRIIGNSQPRYHYGVNLGFSWYGFDVAVFLQGVGRADWYPGANALLFWGPYARPFASFIPKNFHHMYWTEDNKDAYYPRPRGYVATNTYNRELTAVNDRYLQNVGYCRLKNVTVGYALPAALAKKVGMEGVRVYFTGDNLAYLAPGLKSKYIDPEQAINGGNLRVYSWQKTFMFGLDITF